MMGIHQRNRNDVCESICVYLYKEETQGTKKKHKENITLVFCTCCLTIVFMKIWLQYHAEGKKLEGAHLTVDLHGLGPFPLAFLLLSQHHRSANICREGFSRVCATSKASCIREMFQRPLGIPIPSVCKGFLI